MEYNYFEELVKSESKYIEKCKSEILKLKENMSKISNQEEIDSYINNINFLNHIISEKEKLINNINSGNIYKV